MVAKASLGNKHNCFSCQCKFYDMGKTDVICPRCGANKKAAPKVKTPTPRARAADRVREEPYRRPPDEDAEVEHPHPVELSETAELGADARNDEDAAADDD